MSRPTAILTGSIESQADVKAWADWLVELILQFGGTPATAYKCAGLFAEALTEVLS